MKKLAIIPAYNESANIKATIESIRSVAPDYDYIVINDCSSDETEDILRSGNLNHVRLPINLGIGGQYKQAIYMGTKTATTLRSK